MGTVEIPQSVTELGDCAFCYCKNLGEIILPTGVRELGHNCFSHCESLREMVMPASLAYVRFQTFYGCTNLRKITFQGDSPVFGSNDTPNVFKNVTATVYYPEDNITWTENIRKDYGGTITWISYKGVGEQTPQGDWKVVDSGTCGENLNWKLDNYGTLTISGCGEMYDYTYAQNAPWQDYNYEIRAIELEGDITRIGTYAFYYCLNVTGIV